MNLKFVQINCGGTKKPLFMVRKYGWVNLFFYLTCQRKKLHLEIELSPHKTSKIPPNYIKKNKKNCSNIPDSIDKLIAKTLQMPDNNLLIC